MLSGVGSLLLAFAAGTLSTLSPCVLPLLPVLVTGALARHRRGPLALAAGLALSFAGAGLFVATLGFGLGIDAQALRRVAALLMLAAGAVLVSDRLQARFEHAAAGLAALGGRVDAGTPAKGWRGQFALGLLLGAVWAPCTGPTLGAALALAAQARDLPAVTLVMLAFGLGASLPLLVLGRLSRAGFARWRGSLAHGAVQGRRLLGGLLLVLGAAVLSGADKWLEARFVRWAPDWLNALGSAL